MKGVEGESEYPPQNFREDVEDGGLGERVDDVDYQRVEVKSVGGFIVKSGIRLIYLFFIIYFFILSAF